MEIRINKLGKTGVKPQPLDSELSFGKFTTDHMFLMDYDSDSGWHDPRIEPYSNLNLDPTAMIFHYNQQVFEGFKAYRLADGGIGVFRPEKNIERLNSSARRMAMPEVDQNVFLDAITQLVLVDQGWLPTSLDTSLYIRPVMIATEASLGVRKSNKYLFYIIMSPVGKYYSEGFNPTRIFVSTDYVRAARGGVGEAKTSSNYGPSLVVSAQAADKGYTQVLWLDALERKYVEEVGTSNIFFLFGDELTTPRLVDSILPGVTRESVIHIAKEWGIPVSERQIAIDEVISGCRNGLLKEAFATGTSAVVSPIGEIGYLGDDFQVGGEVNTDLACRLYKELTDIQYGRKDDPQGWNLKIG